MKAINKAAFILPIIIGLGLGGCASPNIVIQPTLPALATHQVSGNIGSVWLVVDGAETNLQASRYEERGDKTAIGKSESLGVHLSDFWIQESPPVFVKRMLENNLKAWGYQVVTNPQQVQLLGRINKFTLDSRAINLFEFQAVGVIDVELNVVKDSIPVYKGHYVGTCSYKTATEIPNKENMEKLFNSCVSEFQKRLEEDNKLRTIILTSGSVK